MENKIDNINKPNHYQIDGLGIETIKIIERVLGTKGFVAFCLGNILKYLIRAEKKNKAEDSIFLLLLWCRSCGIFSRWWK